jgi:hypothetical protein
MSFNFKRGLMYESPTSRGSQPSAPLLASKRLNCFTHSSFCGFPQFFSFGGMSFTEWFVLCRSAGPTTVNAAITTMDGTPQSQDNNGRCKKTSDDSSRSIFYIVFRYQSRKKKAGNGFFGMTRLFWRHSAFFGMTRLFEKPAKHAKSWHFEPP